MLATTAVRYDQKTAKFEFENGNGVLQTLRAPRRLPPSIRCRAVAETRHDRTRIAYLSPARRRESVVLVIVTAVEGSPVSAGTSSSGDLDSDLAEAILEAAAQTCNPVGAVRDLISFTESPAMAHLSPL